MKLAWTGHINRGARGARRVIVVFSVFFAVSAVAFLAAALTLGAQSSLAPAAAEWRSYAGDLRNHHYSPLSQVTADNFNALEVAWRFKTDSLGPRPEFKLEGTPLVVNGVLYTTAGTRRSVVSLDAATGELRWVHAEFEGARAAASPRQLSGRGVAYWTDGREERIIRGGSGIPLASGRFKYSTQAVGDGLVRAKDAKIMLILVEFDDIAQKLACYLRIGSFHTTGYGHGDRVVTEVRQAQITQQDTAVSVWIRPHPSLTLRR